jgi:hypothetical protein
MFKGNNDLNILEKVRETEFVRPRQINEAIPEELEALLLRALEKNPADRWEKAADWRDALEHYLFSNNLHYSASWLAAFMREIFREDIDKERLEHAEEAEVAQRLRVDARRAARLEANALAPETKILKLGSAPGVPGPDEHTTRDPALEAFVGGPTEREERPAALEARLRAEAQEDIVEVKEVEEIPEIQEIREVPEEGEDSGLATARLDRPSIEMFSDTSTDKDRLEEWEAVSGRPPIREVQDPISTVEEPRAGRARLEIRTLEELVRADAPPPPILGGAEDSELPTMRRNESGRAGGSSMTPSDLEDTTLPPVDPIRKKRALPPAMLLVVIVVVAILAGVLIAVLNRDRGPADEGDSQAKPQEPVLVDAGSSPADPGPDPPSRDAGLVSSGVVDAGQADPGAGETQGETPPADAGLIRVDEHREDPPPPKPPVPRPRPRPRPRPPVSAERGTGTVDVGVAGGWAFVFVDGAKIKTTPLIGHPLNAGSHVIELQDGDGNVIRRWNFRIKNGQKLKLVHTPGG